MFSFGKWRCPKSHIFLETRTTYAFVNLRPIVPGHILIIPQRKVARFEELTEAEIVDMYTSAQKIGGMLQNHYQATSLTISMQDGPEAGQSVSHVHLHVLPRKAGDFRNNDDIYPALEKNAKELIRVDADDRKDRTVQEMNEEASLYKQLLA